MVRTLFGLLVLGFTVPVLCWAQTDSLCDEKVFDDGTIANSFFYLDSSIVMARRFEGSSSPVGMEWGEINTLSFGEPFYPWPDTSYDPIEITIWEEEQTTGFPKYPPIWTTTVTPSDSPAAVRVYPPDTVVAGSNVIFLGMRNPDAENRAEGLNVDGTRDFGGTLISLDGGLTWQDYHGFGDWHIRACLIYPQGIQETVEAPLLSCKLFPAIPNPFRKSTTLSYSLPYGKQKVRIRVYDLMGRWVKTLVDDHTEGGNHVATWDGRNRDGRRMPSGVYLSRMEVGSYIQTEKVVLVRPKRLPIR